MTSNSKRTDRTVEGCRDCLKVAANGTCVAFTDPGFQHRNGMCFGYIDDPEELSQVVDQMYSYARGVESYRSRLSETLRQTGPQKEAGSR